MMSRNRLVPATLLLSGLFLLLYSVASGGAQLYLFIIFPVFSGDSPLFFVAVLLLIGGFLTLPMFFLESGAEDGMFRTSQLSRGAVRESTGLRSGAVIFIGPIPVLVAGSGRTAFYTLLAVLIFFLIVLLLLFAH